MKSLRVHDGQLDRHTVPAPALMQVFNQCAQPASTAGFGVVHLVEDHDARHVGLFGISPHALRNRLHAVLRIDHDDGRLNRQQRGARFMAEHVKAGRVDEVDLRALPLRKRDGILTWSCRAKLLLRHRP